MLSKFRSELIFVTMLILIIALFSLFLNKLRNDIYFDMWLNDIIGKNDKSSFFQMKDPYWGNEVETKFKVDDKQYVNLKDIKIGIDYNKNLKTLKLYLNTPNYSSKNNKNFYYRYETLGEDASKKICGKVLFIVSDYLGPLHQGKALDVTKNYVKYINCYFTFDENDMASGDPVGGIIYKRSKEKEFFRFNFLKSFNDADFS